MAIPKIKVEVTSKHIKKGVPGNSESCAIALALRGLKLRNVSVSSEVTYTKGGKTYEAVLPKRANNFIGNFDDDKENVKPFSFTLAPYEIDEFGVKVDQRTKKTSTKKGKKTKTTSVFEDTGVSLNDDFDC